MTERGMLSSAEMVRALLKDKTQTRRPMKPQPRKNSVGQWLWGKNHVAFWPEIDNYGPLPTLCPYGKVGDRIWVRETFADLGPRYAYRASRPDLDVRWTPSIHMPRLASRITLEITEVRVQRLQEISEADCVAEGVTLEAFKEWLQPIAANAKTKNLYWINTKDGDLGEEYCRDCADSKVAELIAAGADPEETRVDGGWGSESDSLECCESCGIILEASLTDYAVGEELWHFSNNCFGQSPETAYELLNMADGCVSDEQRLAVAKIAYCWLWESIYGPGSWDRNDWVWALTFKVVSE